MIIVFILIIAFDIALGTVMGVRIADMVNAEVVTALQIVYFVIDCLIALLATAFEAFAVKEIYDYLTDEGY